MKWKLVQIREIEEKMQKLHEIIGRTVRNFASNLFSYIYLVTLYACEYFFGCDYESMHVRYYSISIILIPIYFIKLTIEYWIMIYVQKYFSTSVFTLIY